MNAPGSTSPALGNGPARIGPLLRLAQRRAARTFAEALRPLGIEGRHYGVLLNLDALGPLSQRQLIDLTGSDKSAMVRTVDDLEARGLAVRRPSPADRRAHAVRMTDEGRALFADASRISDAVGAQLFNCMEDGDQELLCELLERFVTAPGT
jgi:MarR family transcriptional regulator, lower aerobic nicotinate degradation pathway regulator